MYKRQIKDIVTGAGHEFAALEKYADASELIAAVADVDALIIRLSLIHISSSTA